MALIPVEIDSIRIGYPLPCDLVDQGGVLLARKSFVVAARADLVTFSQRNGGLFIDGLDAEALRKAYVDQLQTLMRKEKSIGEIAESKLLVDKAIKRPTAQNDRLNWRDFQVRTHVLLRNPTAEHFGERLEQLDEVLEQELRRSADSVLFALMQLSATETAMYSATHALLVAAMCATAAEDVLQWPTADVAQLRKAALTMNIAMAELQDRLSTLQRQPDNQQQAQIASHPAQSAALLRKAGITDPVWLDAVAGHHSQEPGAMADKSPAQRLARLIQRADLFAARLSPRMGRPASSPATAMHACYFDENQQVDEAGAALIKAVGIYPPGSYVRLASEETAVVLRRGANTRMPRVAVVLSRSGLPTTEFPVRDTSFPDYRVSAGLAHQDVKIQIPLERVLPLTQFSAADRPW